MIMLMVARPCILLCRIERTPTTHHCTSVLSHPPIESLSGCARKHRRYLRWLRYRCRIETRLKRLRINVIYPVRPRVHPRHSFNVHHWTRDYCREDIRTKIISLPRRLCYIPRWVSRFLPVILRVRRISSVSRPRGCITHHHTGPHV